MYVRSWAASCCLLDGATHVRILSPLLFLSDADALPVTLQQNSEYNLNCERFKYDDGACATTTTTTRRMCRMRVRDRHCTAHKVWQFSPRFDFDCVSTQATQGRFIETTSRRVQVTKTTRKTQRPRCPLVRDMYCNRCTSHGSTNVSNP